MFIEACHNFYSLFKGEKMYCADRKHDFLRFRILYKNSRYSVVSHAELDDMMTTCMCLHKWCIVNYNEFDMNKPLENQKQHDLVWEEMIFLMRLKQIQTFREVSKFKDNGKW